MALKNSTNAYGTTLRQVLEARGMSLEDLAKNCGLTRATIDCQVGTLARPRTAWIIERALGMPIWTNAEQFRQLVAATDFLDLDFVLTGFHVLLKRASALGVAQIREITNKADLLEAVLTRGKKAPAHRQLAQSGCEGRSVMKQPSAISFKQ